MANHEHSVSNSIVIDALPTEIFDILADPRKHAVIDGSGTVREGVSGPDRLQLDSRFGMQMRMGVGYRISNTVVEFEENQRIAWRHTSPHRWRYELEAVGENSTRVTETFDYSRMPLPKVVAMLGLPKRNQRGIDATLQRLKAYAETGAAE